MFSHKVFQTINEKFTYSLWSRFIIELTEQVDFVQQGLLREFQKQADAYLVNARLFQQQVMNERARSSRAALFTSGMAATLWGAVTLNPIALGAGAGLIGQSTAIEYYWDNFKYSCDTVTLWTLFFG